MRLKEIASDCLSLSPPFSVIHDVFGFWLAPSQRTVSLKRRLELIKGPGFNINVILVGVENFKKPDFEEIDYGVQFAREIYEVVDLCIRKIRWHAISVADAGDYVTLDSEADAHGLTNNHNGPNGNYLDVFVVRATTGGFLGKSAVDGPCSKDDKDRMTGSVVSLSGTKLHTGFCFAHEIGHYLGASKNDPDYHSPDPRNFLYPFFGGTEITSSQANEMKSHCYVKDVC